MNSQIQCWMNIEHTSISYGTVNKTKTGNEQKSPKMSNENLPKKIMKIYEKD